MWRGPFSTFQSPRSQCRHLELRIQLGDCLVFVFNNFSEKIFTH
jgi:hypothetical protein